MSFPRTLNAAQSDSFQVVGAGDQVQDGGFLLSENELNRIEASISAAETEAANHASTTANLNAQIAQLQADLQASRSNEQSLTSQLATVTADRDKWQAEAQEYGANTSDPKETKKSEDEFAGKTKVKNSMDRYAEILGVSRA